ncbi:MAG: cobyrinic acid a,c-diamide synthase [Deltaproteobacteria bacterium]|nr:MAG: cobyrinic acid a,c-diamide synthase [Deltaproteobacteria bacterium]
MQSDVSPIAIAPPPRVTISALRGGSGKTILSLGLSAHWRLSGSRVSVFKKGPDYIDAGWLSMAANAPCHNIDTFLFSTHVAEKVFRHYSKGSDISVIEGNRGLFDGIDLTGDTSTAEIAKRLRSPVILCLDCTKSSRTVAAILLGCLHFDPDLIIGGVILNRVAGNRHENNIRRNVEHYCGVPVVGAIPKLKGDVFPERHMGLIPTEEHAWAHESIAAAAAIARKHLNIETIEAIARTAGDLTQPTPEDPLFDSPVCDAGDAPVIGVLKDSAFQFYYPENIEALTQAGARLVFVSPLEDTALPEDLDALYIGGGFPETHARALSKNDTFRTAIRAASKAGMPIYAECGGLIYLGTQLTVNAETWPMAGVFSIDFGISKKPQGHGYTIVETVADTPFHPKGSVIRGHEFRYSTVADISEPETALIYRMTRGKGIIHKKDGIVKHRTLATYTHIHALGTPAWAPSMVRAALEYRASKSAPRAS